MTRPGPRETDHPASSASRDELLGRLVDDFLRRRADGEALTPADFAADHCGGSSDLRGVLDAACALTEPHSELQCLIDRGVLMPGPTPADPLVYGGYQVTRLIGSGATGVVLAAREQRLHRMVALKILRPELATDATVVARFAREAQATAAVNHPAIATVYTVGWQQRAHFIAMEYVDGPSLCDWLRISGPLPASLARRLFRELLEGLHAAHAAGLIHRDIKPSNILLDGCWPLLEAAADSRSPRLPDHPVVRIVDFGLARLQTSQTQLTLSNAVIGTPQYMSPEQARGDEVDRRSDLYSAGVVLYEMLSGQPPFAGSTPTATLRRIVDEPPRNPRRLARGVNRRLAALALRLLEKRPGNRFATAEQTLAALDGRRRIARLRRRTVAAAAGAMLVLVAAWFILPPLYYTATPIIDARVPQRNPRLIEARYRYLGWWPAWEAPAGSEVTRTWISDIDEDGATELVCGTGSFTASASVAAVDRRGEQVLSLQLDPVPHERTARGGPIGTGVHRLLPADIPGVPRGVEIFVIVNESLGPRSWVFQIDTLNAERRSSASVKWHDPLGHIQHLRIAPRMVDDGGPTYSALFVSMANVWGRSINVRDAAGRTSSLSDCRYSCVPCITVDRSRQWVVGRSASPARHAILFDLPVRDKAVERSAYAAHVALCHALSPWSHGFPRSIAVPPVGPAHMLDIEDLNFVAPEADRPAADYDAASVIEVIMAHDTPGGRPRWRVTLDGELNLVDCQPVPGVPDPDWTRAEIMNAWRRMEYERPSAEPR